MAEVQLTAIISSVFVILFTGLGFYIAHRDAQISKRETKETIHAMQMMTERSLEASRAKQDELREISERNWKQINKWYNDHSILMRMILERVDDKRDQG